ncbi:hypothetical protein [Flavihumibacter profundi]|uniref:hypothetical protein n=1 Tax=Flavihumibacter profundi TaxID=2716883 RepID=UPI001CC37988|nr:hypothetical protein [Flavihumibacter profundi]MBZ5857761.1 hypothetical protein [Flavihumibacter profundi]
MKKIHESLIIFFKCNKSIQAINGLLIEADERNVDTKTLFYEILLQHIILESQVFRQEFEEYFFQRAEPFYRARVSSVKNCSKPLFRRINKWSQLRTFRNQVIAHPWRNSRGDFVFPDVHDYDVPRNAFDHVLLADYYGYIMNIVEQEFKLELKEALLIVKNRDRKNKPKKDYKYLEEDTDKLVYELNSMMVSENKRYELHIKQYELLNEKGGY